MMTGQGEVQEFILKVARRKFSNKPFTRIDLLNESNGSRSGSSLDNCLSRMYSNKLVTRISRGTYMLLHPIKTDPTLPEETYSALEVGTGMISLVNDLEAKLEALQEKCKDYDDILRELQLLKDKNQKLIEEANQLTISRRKIM